MSGNNEPARGHEKAPKSVAQLYQGPIPPPQILAAFNDIIPDGADRIMRMAEKDQDHKTAMQIKMVEVQDSASRREHSEIIGGQIFAFILCALALVGGIYLISIGYLVPGFLLSGATLGGVLKTLITRGK